MILRPAITLPAIYATADWELPLTYYSEFKDSRVSFSLAQPEIVKDFTTRQTTILTNGISSFSLDYQRQESGLSTYEFILTNHTIQLKNLSRGIITETTKENAVILTPIYLSVLPNVLEQELKFNFGKESYAEKLENLVSSIWLESGKQVMSYKVEDNGQVTAIYSKTDDYRLFKFLGEQGDFLPSDSFAKLTKINADQSNSVIEHYKILNSYRNEQGEGIDKFTKMVIDKKPVSYVKLDTTTLEAGDYVIQAWYTVKDSIYKSSPIHFEL
jgi:hypothetical protein